ncbi:MAG: Unknown protein [uncultured Campylobacterales bacterium]|uniref:Cj1289-like C-terminal domain-containing protein n=1 Tax=uncultured Campylobacterales bacterium TaxID=352960 RepID=A0A6S6SQA5_9BACT|nr:MAG: Unknown protein [uncultured Campylobacterales bacterium]
MIQVRDTLVLDCLISLMKILFYTFLITVSLFALEVNKVIASVDNEAITSYDINKLSSQLSKKQKIDSIIQQKIEKILVEKYDIKVSDAQIDEYIKGVAKSNGISSAQYMRNIANKGITRSSAYSDFRMMLIKKNLYQQIVQMNHNVKEKDIKDYYENNKNLFTMPSKISVRVYSSTDRQELVRQTQTPMFMSKKIMISDEVVEKSDETAKLFNFLLRVQENSFSPIIKLGDFKTFYVNSKSGQDYVAFEQVQDVVLQKVIESKKIQILDNFFQNYRKTLNIQYKEN